MISVYRIYLGHSWVAHGEAAKLCGLFDQLPEFLHDIHSLPLDAPEAASLTTADRHAAVRIAMTPAHVVILRAADADTGNPWTTEEMVTARTGFRHRIPVLAILPPGREIASAADHVRMADKTVAWNNVEIARGVQDLAQAAAADRRVMLDRVARRSVDADHGHAPRDRPLPIEQIAEAYRFYTAARQSHSSQADTPRSPPRK